MRRTWEYDEAMALRPVHWHEGMFLRPHHFQAASRYQTALVARTEKWNAHYNWGVRSIELDETALSNSRLVIRSLRARLHDGTPVAIPDDTNLPEINLKPAFERETAVMVYLGLPVLHSGRPNVSKNDTADALRYLIETNALEDENTGQNPQDIDVRLLNLRLLLSTDDMQGYETLPLARLIKSAAAEGAPELDLSYVPPLLATDAWKPLNTEVLHKVFDRVGRKLNLLADQIVNRGITFDSQAQGDRKTFEQVRILSEASALFNMLFFAEGVHPFTAYGELCRLVGQLAILGAQRRPPDLPRYDHDDLGKCFYTALRHIDDLLNIIEEPIYKERPFIGSGLRMQVSLESSWLEPQWLMFVGMRSPLAAEDAQKLMTKDPRSGHGLDMKIGSSERADEIFKLGLPGLRFNYNPKPPRALPSIPGLIYFEVDRASQKEEWARVQQTLTLAIRMNERLIDGNIQGQKRLTIRTSGQNTWVELTLFVMPQEPKSQG